MIHMRLNFMKLTTALLLFGGVMLFAALDVRGETPPASVTNTSVGIYPCPIDADIWLLGGQSNMDGQDIVKKYPTKEDPRIVAFDMVNQWMTAKDPLHRLFEAAAPIHRKLCMQWMTRATTNSAEAEKMFEKHRNELRNNPRGVGLGIPFAQAVLQETGRPIGLIACAHGGTSMGQWDPALKDKGDDSLYGAMMNRVKMAGGGKKIKGLLWYQGESEAGSAGSITNFPKNFLNFIDCVRRDLDQPELPVIYVQIGRYVLHAPELGSGWEQIRELQRCVARERKNIYFTTAIDQTLFDKIHVSGSGQQCLGRRMAELALTYVYSKPDHGKQIDLESASVTNFGREIHLKFSGVSGKLQSLGRPGSFELRSDAPGSRDKPMIFRVDFDPEDPAALNLVVEKPVTGSIKLIYGPGIDPYMNLVDDKNMPVPAFGPVEVIAGK